MKIEIYIEGEIEDKDISPKSPLIKILKLLRAQSEMLWCCDQKKSVLGKVEKRKYVRKSERLQNENTVEMVMPEDNILRFN